MRRVILESPYAGDVEANVAYTDRGWSKGMLAAKRKRTGRPSRSGRCPDTGEGTMAKVETYRRRGKADSRQQSRWRVRAQNGRKIANGGEGYANEADMLAAMRSVRDALTAFLDG